MVDVVDVVDVMHDKGDGNGNDDDELEGQYSSEFEESIESIDSIARNADFISLYQFVYIHVLFLLQFVLFVVETTHLLSPT